MINEFKWHLLNLPGWHTKRNIVVIQSDDWGSIRMPSEKVRQQLDTHSKVKANDAYSRYDTLASTKDLEALFETLTSVKDKNGKSAVLTANCLIANPDFEAIRRCNFEEYHYETLDKTFERYNNGNALELWKEGMDHGIFYPQFHGREHVNVPFWMHQLQGHSGVRTAFEHGVFGVNFHGLPYRKRNFQAAWDYDTEGQAKQINQSIEEGLLLFENRFGYCSKTAIAPSYTWSKNQQQLLLSKGVKAMQGILVQKVPSPHKKNYQKKWRIFEGWNSMSFQLRNVFFEPSLNQSGLDISDALRRIRFAFTIRKPAIIGMHRLNFVGSLNNKNRDQNLELLNTLLHRIVKTWPEVEFMSLDRLLINENLK